MSHKAIFFNFASHWGEEVRQYIAASPKFKSAAIEIGFADGTLDSAHIPAAKDFDIAGVFMDSKVDATTIENLPNIKLVTTLSTGFDHIDFKAAAAKGIVVSSVPAYGENTVAEFAFALILALSRKVCEARDAVRAGKFSTEGLQGFDLAGKTIGVIGTGRIGKHAVRMAKGFAVKVVAYDVYHDDAFAKEIGFTYVTLEELLAQSDIITIHCPYLPSTHHLINSQNVGLIKKGAYLINTARGAVVETAALISALKNGQLGGAGIDVLEEEARLGAGAMDPIRDLIAMPNVIVTPHNAFNSKEAAYRIFDTTIDNIVAFAEGAPINVVR